MGSRSVRLRPVAESNTKSWLKALKRGAAVPSEMCDSHLARGQYKSIRGGLRPWRMAILFLATVSAIL